MRRGDGGAKRMAEKNVAAVCPSRRLLWWLSGCMLAAIIAGTPLTAGADKYDPKQAGHPLRIVAYVVHPIGVALDYVVMRPAYWVGSHEPFKTLFGRTD